jgi:hypothetical protein
MSLSFDELIAEVTPFIEKAKVSVGLSSVLGDQDRDAALLGVSLVLGAIVDARDAALALQQGGQD